jgi:uncharacterized protein
VKLVDANVLLYAVNEDAAHHRAAKRWLDDALAGGATVAWSWIVVLAFLRIATRPGIFPRPLPAATAVEIVRRWLGAPTSVVVEPGVQHLDVLVALLTDTGTAGNLVSDAHLAALAIEHRATVVTFDRDFVRFARVEVERPAAG